MTKDEKNRAIAEWLGWAVFPDGWGGYAYQKTMHDSIQPLPDFYLSEEASALVRDAVGESCGKILHKLCGAH